MTIAGFAGTLDASTAIPIAAEVERRAVTANSNSGHPLVQWSERFPVDARYRTRTF